MMTQEAQPDMTRDQSLRDEKAKDQRSTAGQPRERDLIEQVQFAASGRQTTIPHAEIDERRRDAADLRLGELRSGQLAESIQAIPWEADAATFRFLFVGQQAVTILGYPVEDWLRWTTSGRNICTQTIGLKPSSIVGGPSHAEKVISLSIG